MSETVLWVCSVSLKDTEHPEPERPFFYAGEGAEAMESSLCCLFDMKPNCPLKLFNRSGQYIPSTLLARLVRGRESERQILQKMSLLEDDCVVLDISN
jgi:hypothetical protein